MKLGFNHQKPHYTQSKCLFWMFSILWCNLPANSSSGVFLPFGFCFSTISSAPGSSICVSSENPSCRSSLFEFISLFCLIWMLLVLWLDLAALTNSSLITNVKIQHRAKKVAHRRTLGACMVLCNLLHQILLQFRDGVFSSGKRAAIGKTKRTRTHQIVYEN